MSSDLPNLIAHAGKEFVKAELSVKILPNVFLFVLYSHLPVILLQR